ncbi:hypothetical protein NODU109028_04725 [Nocardioides dubius]
MANRNELTLRIIAPDAAPEEAARILGDMATGAHEEILSRVAADTFDLPNWDNEGGHS